jgi:hypothetical protein
LIVHHHRSFSNFPDTQNGTLGLVDNGHEKQGPEPTGIADGESSILPVAGR